MNLLKYRKEPIMYYLSIVTVSFNDKDALLRTMKSIFPIPNYCEWIIVDADSQDGTKEFLNSLPKQNNITWISEKDHGIYDGMNKGIHLASGQYVAFMNAGDMYVRQNLEAIANRQYCEHEILVFDYIPLNSELEIGYSRLFTTDIKCIESYDCIPHQSTLIAKKLFSIHGGYNINFKYAADYDFFSKVYIYGHKFIFNPDIKLSYFVQDGVSSDLKNSLKIACECQKIQLKYFNKYSKKLFFVYLLKYIISFFPASNSIFNLLRMICLHKKK